MDSFWLILIAVGVPVVALVLFALWVRRSDRKMFSKMLSSAKKGFGDYLRKKREIDKRVEEEKAALPDHTKEPFSPEAAEDFLKRSDEPWPPKD